MTTTAQFQRSMQPQIKTQPRYLKDAELLDATKKLAATEREILADVLRHLAEIQRRKLFSPRFPSLYDYAQIELRYSSDQAARRIAAMQLLRDLPEIENDIANGALNLTTLGLAQTHFRAEKGARNAEVSRDEKIETLVKLSRQSSREAARTLITHSSAPEKLTSPETVRPVSAMMNELRVHASDATLQKIARLKGLMAHKHPHLSNGELLDLALDIALESLDPAVVKPRERRGVVPHEILEQKSAARSKPMSPSTSLQSEKVRAAGVVLKREVWRRAGGKCETCGSQHALETDHQIPFALGGQTTLPNLRLLCRNCNQRAAIQAFGVERVGRAR